MKNGQISSQASAFLLSVTNTLVLTNTLAYYGICRLQIRNVFIVQASGECRSAESHSVACHLIVNVPNVLLIVKQCFWN
jgi:hypothetical protein